MILKINPEDVRPVDRKVHTRLWPIERDQPQTEEAKRLAEELENKKCALAELKAVNDAREAILKKYPELAYFEHLTIVRITEVVSEYYGLRTNEVLSPRRNRMLAHARFVIYFFCRELLSKSYPEIGRRCSGRDHSTVIHGIHKLETMLKTDENLASDVAKIRDILLEMRKNRGNV